MKDQRPTIRLGDDRRSIILLDQRRLPEEVIELRVETAAECADAISDMVVRGAPLIGVTGLFGLWLAACEAEEQREWRESIEREATKLLATRPTAVNLRWGLERGLRSIASAGSGKEASERLLQESLRLLEEDRETCRQIGLEGVSLIEDIAARKSGQTINILTHCNAGRLACVDFGTATSPIYQADERGINLHVWVDETRPRLQGGKLTAFELQERSIPYTIIPDNTAGALMMRGEVDIVIVGCDRMTRHGDACNKIGTYPLALAAADNAIPFYVALPASTIDFSLSDYRQIPIEERSATEVLQITGITPDGSATVSPFPHGSPALNIAFDITPARLITGIITEHGIIKPTEEEIGRIEKIGVVE